jgi:hypothetical protein
MKKLFFFFAILLAGGLLFISCKKTDFNNETSSGNSDIRLEYRLEYPQDVFGPQPLSGVFPLVYTGNQNGVGSKITLYTFWGEKNNTVYYGPESDCSDEVPQKLVDQILQDYNNDGYATVIAQWNCFEENQVPEIIY